LMDSGLVQHSKAAPAHLKLSSSLQANFSIFSDLSLFLVEVAKSLGIDEDPLLIVSLVEGIQENPMPILYAQRKKRRGEVVEALKQEGVPFEERMERLEHVSWDIPPCDEQLTAMYRHYCDMKPYLAEDLFQSKSIARHLLESGATINEFIRDYGLKRAEGTVVRYLSQTVKVIKQTLPANLTSSALLECVSELEALIRQVDSSFIVDPMATQPKPDLKQQPLPPFSFSDAKKHIRRTVHQILNAWQANQFERIADRFVGEDGETLSTEQIQPSLDAYEAVHGDFRLTPAFRDISALIVKEDAAQSWTFTQHLGQDASDEDWYLIGRLVASPGPSSHHLAMSFLGIEAKD
ncbi:MAG: DUF3516 domain-containing protein, partial [Bradymonadia bacterium]